MSEPIIPGEGSISSVIPEIPFRAVQHGGKVYDKLVPGGSIDIGILGKVKQVLDVENLGLEKVTNESLNKQWESQKRAWTKQCEELGIDIDPFDVFTIFLVQEKAIKVLGHPENTKQMERTIRMMNQSKEGSVRLSDMKGVALCSEFALLETYMLQTLGVSAHLISGAFVNPETQYRDPHMYTWIGGGVNAVLEGTLAREGEYPALMKPIKPTTLHTLEAGHEIACKRVFG